MQVFVLLPLIFHNKKEAGPFQLQLEHPLCLASLTFSLDMDHPRWSLTMIPHLLMATILAKSDKDSKKDNILGGIPPRLLGFLFFFYDRILLQEVVAVYLN